MSKLEIYVLAYNNLFCVDYQIKTFKAFCKDDYNLVIIDSNCGEYPENTERKKQLCKKMGVEFIELPTHLSLKGLNPTDILGRKLNFVFYQIVKPRNPRYFAFIDQDFFPFREFEMIPRLEELGMYGDVCEQDGQKTPTDKLEDVLDTPWVLHPWLSFYKTDFFDGFEPNWDWCLGFDTGGKNWEAVISKKNLDKKRYWNRHKTMMYFPFDEISGFGPPGFEKHYFKWGEKKIYSQIQIYDNNFVHMLNSRELDDPFNPKTNFCKGFLDSSILFSGNLAITSEEGFHNEGPCYLLS